VPIILKSHEGLTTVTAAGSRRGKMDKTDSTVVKHLSHHPKVEGLTQTTTINTRRREMETKVADWYRH
jgi:hypothetical protein